MFPAMMSGTQPTICPVIFKYLETPELQSEQLEMESPTLSRKHEEDLASVGVCGQSSSCSRDQSMLEVERRLDALLH